MEAAAHPQDDHDHHHDHGDDVELNPATWRDAKRYAWLLGLIIPLAPFIAWGFGRGDRLVGLLVLRPAPRLRRLPDPRHRRSASTPPTRPTASSSGSSRTATTAGAPTSSSRSSTSGSSSPATSGRAATSASSRASAWRVTMGVVGGIGDQHRPRARPQARQPRALAEPGRPRPDRLRPLLHRAQPRPPRPRRDPGGPGQRPAGGELLGLPAAHRLRQPHLRLGDRVRPPRPHGQVALDACATTSSAPGR